MGDRRMLTKKVTDDDNFMALSASAQALYLHLSMSADDDGFCNQVSICMFKAHASVQDLQALLEKRYIYQFDNGVIVIKHWRMANALRKDRYTPTVFQEELAKLKLKENGAYTWLPDGCQMVADGLPDGCPNISKDNSSKDNLSKSNTPPISPSRGNEGEMLEEAFGYNQYLLDAVKDWLAYKKEKRQGYGERGLKSLLTQLKNRVSEYGEDAVIEVIQESMAANYQGITWDKLKNQNRQQKPSSGYSFMDILKQEEKNESYRNS